ncbi:MAG: type secretion protein Rhs, partial [Mucilaginibacter sp.]|nr:type secretion protein Rhs [Mucilaginibacter sp.]
RVVSPNAGSGDTGKNRGFLVVPEKGDQVIVAFEEGNIARPVVMGSVYHTNNVNSGGFTNSNIKGMTSRKGSNLTFNDGTHALALATSAANTFNVHEGDGSVQTTAAQTISHKTGTNLIEVKNKDGSITLKSDTVITIQSGESSITLNTNGTISIKGKIFNVNATDNNIQGTNNHIQGAQTKIDGGKTFIA